MIRLLMLLGLLASPAQAETALVYSGEHEGFTRLVIELPNAGDWTVGRTPMGYAFAAVGEPKPQFDISQVFRRIPRTRLQALQHDADTGALRLTLACACHVFPFEYEPGIVVLDIKPGPAPKGSSFETPFELPRLDILSTDAPAATQGYNWLETKPPATTTSIVETDLILPTGVISLAPLREELLLEISRGAARGVVDMTLPEEPAVPALSGGEVLPWTQIHIGPSPEASVSAEAKGKDGQSFHGETCLPDERLSLADWGRGRRHLDILSEARAGLYAEFDALDPEAALRSVRLHLYLGFGAEAAQYAELLSEPEHAYDIALLRSMALIVDGATAPGAPFEGMLACDGAAALWATLATEDHPPGAVVNGDAVARTFMALPPHLRAALGERLAERLLGLDQTEAARIVRDAIGRTPDVAMATVDRMEAKAELHAGEPEEALAHAEAAVTQDGSEVQAWMALVEAHFRKGEPLAADKANALRAFESEIAGTDGEADYFRALALAEVLSGQTAGGFAIAKDHGVPLSDLWQVTVDLAEDDAFLRHAVVHTPDPVRTDLAAGIAARLVELGFPDAAAAWLTPTGPEDAPERRRIAAKAELARRDARRSLDLLGGLHTPEDEALRAEAFVQLGQIAEAREAYEAAGLGDVSLRLAAWEGSWAELESAEGSPWSPALTDLASALPGSAGPLARGEAMIEASASARVAVEALLSGLALPES